MSEKYFIYRVARSCFFFLCKCYSIVFWYFNVTGISEDSLIYFISFPQWTFIEHSQGAWCWQIVTKVAGLLPHRHFVTQRVKVKFTQSCLTLCDPTDYGILQARIVEWVAFPYPGDFPKPGIEPRPPESTFYKQLHFFQPTYLKK